MLLSPIQTLDPAKVERDLAFLMGCFREVLEESGELALLAHLPWGADRAAGRPARSRRSGCRRRTRLRFICSAWSSRTRRCSDSAWPKPSTA